MALALCFLLSSIAQAGTPAGTSVERGFAKALDRETDGRFSKLVEARDPALTIEHFDALRDAYSRIADRLYAEYSIDAIEFPGWWTAQLVELGLGQLSDADTAQLDFFRRQLESEDFERVVHGYYVLSLNASALRETGVDVPALREQLVSRAKADESHRFWISLWLAESRLLGHPSDAAGRARTQTVKGLGSVESLESVESVREYVGKTAKQLGPRIHRILDLPREGADDPRVTHYYISQARRSAEDRVRRQWLLAEGPSAGYRSIRRELEEFRDGSLRSQRFLQILEKDLHYLFDEFGLPADPRGMLQLMREIYREQGKFGFDLRVAIDELTRVYELRRLEEVGGRPRDGSNGESIELDASARSVEEILQLGPDGAHAFLVEALNDSTRGERIRMLLGRDVVSKLIESYPPEDPSQLKGAVVAGYASIGHPASLRANYLTALSGLDKLAPDTERPPAWSSREGVLLAKLFAQADSGKDFAKDFRALHRAAESGAFQAGAEPPPELVQAIAQAAVRLIQQHDAARRLAAGQAVRADRALSAAGSEMREARRAATAHNREIGLANEELEAAEDRFQAAVGERNSAVETLNDAVSEVNSARMGLRDARQRGASESEFEALASREAAAISRVTELDRLLDSTIEAAEQSAARASGDADTAEQNALAARERARSAQQRGEDAGLRENDSYDDRAAARSRVASSTAGILEILNQSALCLHLMGVRASGEDANARLAGWVGYAAQVFAGEDGGGEPIGLGATLERELESVAPSTRELAKLVRARQRDPGSDPHGDLDSGPGYDPGNGSDNGSDNGPDNGLGRGLE